MLQIERSAQIDRDDLGPELRIGIDELHWRIPAGIIDQRIDSAMGGSDSTDRGLHGRIVGDIEDAGLAAATRRKHGLPCAAQRPRVDVRRDDDRVFGGEAPAQRLADAATGNQYHLVRESAHVPSVGRTALSQVEATRVAARAPTQGVTGEETGSSWQP